MNFDEVVRATTRSTAMYKDFFTGQQDRQCKYNVTLRRVRATIIAVDKKEV